MDQAISFAYSGLKTTQFAMIKEVIGKAIALNISTNVSGDYNNSTITIGLRVEFASDESSILIIETESNFSIKDDNWCSLSNNCSENVIFPKDFIEHLVAVSLSSTRGVLCAKTEGTKFDKYFLPLFNVTELKCNPLEVKNRQ